MIGTNVLVVIFLFGNTIVRLFASIWQIFLWAIKFIIFAHYWTKSIAKLDIVVGEAFVNADIILLISRSSVRNFTFDLFFSTFDLTYSFTCIIVIINSVTLQRNSKCIFLFEENAREYYSLLRKKFIN